MNVDASRARGALAGLAGGGEGPLPALALALSRTLAAGFSRQALEGLSSHPAVLEALRSGPASICLGTAVPVGVLHASELRGITENAGAACRLLHDDARCVAGCRAVAMAVALAVRGQPERIVERASLLASPSPSIRAAVEGERGGAPGTVLRAVSEGFALLASAPEGLDPRSLRTVDPVAAAVAGALLGARHGIQAFSWAAEGSGLAAAADGLLLVC